MFVTCVPDHDQLMMMMMMISLQMKSVIAVVMMAGVALTAPGGGYTGLGGVYKELNQDADYIHLAKNAAKMQIDLFQDESLTTDEEVRPARKAVYVPTFFTSVPQESVPSQVATRFRRNANTAQESVPQEEEEVPFLETALQVVS